MGKSNPLKKMPKEIPESGNFAAKRKHDIHTGIDLHCHEGDSVYAIEDGIVKKVAPFTGGVESPWWNDTDYIGILSSSGYIIYGEVTSLVFEGQFIKSGQIIGKVKQVLKKDKGSPTSMLHLELYSKFCEPVVWNLNEKQPETLLNPISLIQK